MAVIDRSALRAAVARLEAAEHALGDAREARDAEIRRLLHQRVPQVLIALDTATPDRPTGLSREQIRRIGNTKPKHVDQPSSP